MRIAGLAVMVVGARAAKPEVAPMSQVLVYANGDRLQGRLVSREGDTLVFRSVRFGELRVPADKAQVISTPPVVRRTPVAKVAQAVRTPSAEPDDEPRSLARRLRGFFGPWSGRLAVSSQINRDTRTRSDFLVETRLARKWPHDEVSTTDYYRYAKTDGNVTADVARGNGMWRHTLPNRIFTVYRPAYEWNSAYKIGGVNSDYMLLQQEAGGGVTLVKTKKTTVRAGLSENRFDTWEESGSGHSDTHAESAFSEADVQLPGRISLAERAVFYYAEDSGIDGWEHQLEITKKLTDTLSMGLKHEVRYNAPDVRSQDYTLLRLLLGLDF